MATNKRPGGALGEACADPKRLCRQAEAKEGQPLSIPTPAQAPAGDSWERCWGPFHPGDVHAPVSSSSGDPGHGTCVQGEPVAASGESGSRTGGGNAGGRGCHSLGGGVGGGGGNGCASGEQQEFVAWVLKCLDSDEEETAAGAGGSGGGGGEESEPLTLEKVLAEGRTPLARLAKQGDDSCHPPSAGGDPLLTLPDVAAVAAALAVPQLEGPPTPRATDGCHVAGLFWQHAPLGGGGALYPHLPDLVGADDCSGGAPDVDFLHIPDSTDVALQFLLESSEEEGLGTSPATADMETLSSSCPWSCRPPPGSPAQNTGNDDMWLHPAEAAIACLAGGATPSADMPPHGGSRWRAGEMPGGAIAMSGLPGIDPLTEELARLVEVAEDSQSGGGGDADVAAPTEHWDCFEESLAFTHPSPVACHL